MPRLHTPRPLLVLVRALLRARGDLLLQLRKAGIDKVILAGMSSNLCTESHMRSLVEALAKKEGVDVEAVARQSTSPV